MVDQKKKKPASKKTAPAAAKAKPKAPTKPEVSKKAAPAVALEPAADVEAAVQKHCTVRLFQCGHSVFEGELGEEWRADELGRLVLPAGFEQPRRRLARNALSDQIRDLLI